MADRVNLDGTILYRWPGGTLNTLRPIELDESQELVQLLGPLLAEQSNDAAAVVQNNLSQCLVRMLDLIAINLEQKQHSTAEKQANMLLPFHNPAPGSDAHMVAAEFAKNLEISSEKFQRAVGKTGKALINSGTDKRQKTLLAAFSGYIVVCADEVLGNWTLPTTADISDKNYEPGPGVFQFAEGALLLLCGRLRSETPIADSMITEVEVTGGRALLDALQKSRALTMEKALETMRSNMAKQRARTKKRLIPRK